MSWLEQLALSVVMALLHGAIKNPAKLKGAEGIIIKIRDDATLLVGAIDPSAPPPPGYVKQ